MRGADAGPSMLDRLIADRELAQVEADHLGLDLDLIELLARVNPNHAADHLGHHDHVPQVRFHQVGFLVRLGFLFGFAQLFDQAHGFALEAAVEAAAGTRVHDVAQLFRREVEESVKSACVSKGRWWRTVR